MDHLAQRVSLVQLDLLDPKGFQDLKVHLEPLEVLDQQEQQETQDLLDSLDQWVTSL